MPAYPVVINVTFKKTVYEIVKASPSNGTFELNPAGTANYGDRVTVTPAPATGYEVDAVTVTKKGDPSTTVAVGADGTFTMPDYPVDVKVTFKKKNYEVGRGSAPSNGSFSVSPSSGTANYGDRITVTPSADTGYETDRITVTKKDDPSTAVAVGSDGTFTMPAYPVVINVTFKKTDYTITKTSAVNGTYSVKRNSVVVTAANYLDTIVVETAPATDYVLDAIFYNDGTDHEITAASAFTMPAKNVTIKVTFKKAEGSDLDTLPGNEW